MKIPEVITEEWFESKEGKEIWDAVSDCLTKATENSKSKTQIPKEYLRKEFLTRNHRNYYQLNTLHSASTSGTLDKIPKEFLTEENLNIATGIGNTCFHLAAANGYLEKIPTSLLTPKNLLVQKDKNKLFRIQDTPLWNAFICLNKEKRERNSKAIPPKEWVSSLNRLLEELKQELVKTEHNYDTRALDALMVKINSAKALKEMPSLKA